MTKMTPKYADIKELMTHVDKMRDSLDTLKKDIQDTHMREVKGNHLFYHDTPAGNPLFATEIRISDLLDSIKVLDGQYGILWGYLLSEAAKAAEREQVDKT